jgi:hypothetical protein
MAHMLGFFFWLLALNYRLVFQEDFDFFLPYGKFGEMDHILINN